ncbi:MAG TPA: GlsB/YeaQ/YmgE family stress response membrane protein [Ktedonobacteraceae bacterium]
MTVVTGFHFAVGDLLSWLIIGGLAGWLASVVIRGRGYGCLGNVIVGLIGAVVGGFLASLFDITGYFHFWGSLLVSFLGACVLLFILQALTGRRNK